MITAGHIAAKIGGVTPVFVPGVQAIDADDQVQELDGTDATGEGYEQPDFGLSSLRLRMTLVIDVIAGDLVTISRGTTISELKIYAHVDATLPIYDIPEFKVFRSNPRGEIGGKFAYDIEGKAVGAYTLNDPSALS